jgi:outer membrane protein assembly factor BamD
MMTSAGIRFGAAVVGVFLAATLASNCASNRNVVPPGMLEADKYLYEKGTALLASKKWITAREYFRQLVDNYPQSGYRPDAKLGLGDTYIGEGTTESYVLAQNEFKEFQTFYPTHKRADYAQYRLGYTHFKQMLAPDRDQTATRDTVAEWTTFVTRYPNSPLLPEVRARLREARDRLTESEYRVGLFYFRSRWYPGAVDRLKSAITSDPEYTNRDAVYFYLAESLVMLNRKAEALPYYDRLVKEFEKSSYLADAQRQVEAIKNNTEPAKPIKK